MKQTTKEIILWAWNNVPASYRDATPLLAVVAQAINDLPSNEPIGRLQRHLQPCADRIGKGVESALGESVPALDYMHGWTGDWEVTNVDLRAFDLFRMWLGRAEDGSARHALSDVLRAVRCKRAYQAYLRYQKSGLTAEHCALLANMGWEMDMFRGDWVSLFVQGKRPFGNSSIALDIFEHAGWEMTWDEEEGMSDSDAERAWNLFDELIFAAPDAAKKAAAALASQNNLGEKRP